MVFPLYALSASADYISSENFGSWVTRNSPEFLQRWTHGFFGAGCTVSEDGRHHASSFQTDLGTGYYDCICSECGHTFRAYYQDSYDQSVSELPSPIMNSDGSFWIPAHWNGHLSVNGYKDTDNPQYFSNVSIYGDMLSFTTYPPVSANNIGPRGYIEFSPITLQSGTLTFFGTKPYSWSTSRDNFTLRSILGDSTLTLRNSFGSSLTFGSNGLFFSGTIDLSQLDSFSLSSAVSYSKPTSYGPQYIADYILCVDLNHLLLYTPYSSYNIISGDTYNIDNRVGSLVGNYTYEGDNGTQVIAEDIQIVNETDQSVYNPVTNETYYYNEYTYNYGDRSYDFSFGDRDDHVSVTYGDDCVTIEDGDHTYKIYYTTGTNCSHTYEVSRVVDPTCVDCGYTYRTCTLCGDEQVTEIASFGHDWVVVEQTQHDLVLPDDSCPECESNYFTPELDGTTFHCHCNDCGHDWDQEADVSEYGHVTYECTRCGEQRTEDNTAPTFWDWWREQWYEFKAWYQSLSFNHSDPALPDDPDSDDPSFNDVANDSRRSLWEILLKLFKNLNGIFDETGDAVDGMNLALSEPEDDTSVWYIFDVPYEYMSPVGEGD